MLDPAERAHYGRRKVDAAALARSLPAVAGGAGRCERARRVPAAASPRSVSPAALSRGSGAGAGRYPRPFRRDPPNGIGGRISLDLPLDAGGLLSAAKSSHLLRSAHEPDIGGP